MNAGSEPSRGPRDVVEFLDVDGLLDLDAVAAALVDDVVEVGSFLSHAGTVAREYGLPCVVDVTDCSSRIATGDRLFVDGDAGLVRILS